MAVRIDSLVATAHAALKTQVARIDALNVYPVPDGDTGTNMLLTLESIVNETRDETYEGFEDATRDAARATVCAEKSTAAATFMTVPLLPSCRPFSVWTMRSEVDICDSSPLRIARRRRA